MTEALEGAIAAGIAAAMRETKDLWCTTDENARFLSAVGGVLLVKDLPEEDRRAVKEELDFIRRVHARIRGGVSSLNELTEGAPKRTVNLRPIWELAKKGKTVDEIEEEMRPAPPPPPNEFTRPDETVRNKQEILHRLKYHESDAIDGRDMARLLDYVTLDEVREAAPELLAKGAEPWETTPLTREAVLKAFERDLAFAFEKALDQRGISADCMFHVVRAYGWLLKDDEIANWPDDKYAQYGLPLLKRAADKYGFPNPIGSDSGTEAKYASEG